MANEFFTTYSLQWTYNVGVFKSANKEIDRIRVVSKAKAVEYFRLKYPSLDDDGYAKYENGSVVMCEVFQ